MFRGYGTVFQLVLGKRASAMNSLSQGWKKVRF